jgi:AraC-like DNA-binding protein
MRLEYFAPSPEYLLLLTMHAAIEDVGEPTVEVLPAMLPNLHIRLAGACTYVFADGRRVSAPAVSLIGPTNGAYRMELSPDLRMAAVGFLPTGWLSLVRCSGGELADALIDGEDLWGRRACESVCDQLQAEALDGGHVGIVERLLSRPCRAPRHLDYVAAADRWLERSKRLSVDVLSAELDVGRRHLQRIMLECYGAPPKAVAVKYRALRAAASMAVSGRAAVADALTPFADQAHFNRDFRRFIGVTPGVFIRERTRVVAATMVGRSIAGATRPLVLWS